MRRAGRGVLPRRDPPGQDRAIRLWDVATGTSRVFHGHQDLVTDLVFTPDGKSLLSIDAKTVRIWRAELGTDLLADDGPRLRERLRSLTTAALAPDHAPRSPLR